MVGQRLGALFLCNVSKYASNLQCSAFTLPCNEITSFGIVQLVLKNRGNTMWRGDLYSRMKRGEFFVYNYYARFDS